MEALFTWFVNDIAVWLIAYYTFKSFGKAQNEGKTGEAIRSLVIGGIAYYIAKNPVVTLEYVGNIFSKILNRG